MTLAVYLAAPYGARETVADYAKELERVSMRCTSSWLQETHDIKPGTQGAATELDDATVSGHAVKDFMDVKRSDVLVLFTSTYIGVDGGGGRHIETGFALALLKPVIVVGSPENVFHRIQRKPGSHGWDVQVVADWHEAVLELVAIRDVARARENAAVEVTA